MISKRTYGQGLLLAGLLGITATLYWPGLGGPLLFDDYASIKPLLEMGSLPVDWKAFVMSPTGPLGRPLSMLTFLANLQWSGDDLWAWKATNLFLHGALGCLLFAVTKLLLTISLPAARIDVTRVALLIAALWLLHPLHPSTVLYTVQRMTQLSALFMVAGIVCYLCGRTRTEDSLTARILIWCPYVFFLPLAALSKENGLLLPAFLAVLEVSVLRGVGSIAVRRHAIGLLILFLALPFAAACLYYATHFETAFREAYLNRGFTISERLLTESRVLVEYLGQIVVPSRQRLGFFHDDIVLSTSLLSPPTTALSLLFLMGLVVTAWRLRQRAPLVTCGVLWFFVGHSMEASIVPLELMFEHRNYLPSYGIIIAAVGGLAGTKSSVFGWRGFAVAIALLGLYAAVTRSIINDWRDESHLYAAFYQAHPRSPTAASQVAEFLAGRKQYDDARAVLAPLPGVGAELHRWYLECRQHGMLTESMLDPSVVTREKTLTTYAVTGLIELAKLGLDDECRFSMSRFAELLEHAIRLPIVIPSNRQKLTIYAAHFAWKNHDYASAFARLHEAHEMTPEDPMPLFLLSEWKLARMDIDGATRALEAAENVARRSWRDYSKTIASVRALINEQANEVPR